MITETIKNSLSLLTGTISNMTELDIQHKQDFEKFVLAETKGSLRTFVGELYGKWHQYNREYFGNKLIIPTYITLSNTRTTRRLGEYSSISSWGGTSEIRVKPSLFTGKHPSINASAPMEGRKRYLFDILLHEMVHQFQIEILGKSEESFHGHGPVFRDECNRTSDILGIAQRVRTSKKRGKDKHLPSCAYWPECVRPDNYYMGALIEQKERPEPEPPEEPTTETTKNLELVLLLIQELTTEERRQVAHVLDGMHVWGETILPEEQQKMNAWIQDEIIGYCENKCPDSQSLGDCLNCVLGDVRFFAGHAIKPISYLFTLTKSFCDNYCDVDCPSCSLIPYSDWSENTTAKERMIAIARRTPALGPGE